MYWSSMELRGNEELHDLVTHYVSLTKRSFALSSISATAANLAVLCSLLIFHRLNDTE